MLAFARAGLLAALFAVLSIPALAADKPFQRDDLADSAIRLEAQIKKDAGSVVKPAATLRREVDAAFQKNDLRAGMRIEDETIPVRASTAEGEERSRLWSLMAEVWPAYDDYQTQTDREIPVVVLTRRPA